MKIKSHIPITVDVGEAEALRLGVKRLNFEERSKLRACWAAMTNMKGEEQEEAYGELIADAFRKYIRLDSTVEVEFADGEVTKLRKAEELLEFFGGTPHIGREVFFQVLGQNSLTEDQKKALRRLGGSSASSEGPEEVPVGETPDPTATSAELADSASSEDAPAPPETSPSGSTEPETKTEDPPSSSTNARSVH